MVGARIFGASTQPEWIQMIQVADTALINI